MQYDTFDATSFLDWNQDGRINTSVRANINQDVVRRGNMNYHKFTTLRGFEQWSRLVYTGGLVGTGSISSAIELPSKASIRCFALR